ncbi:MAG: bacterial transcriptional activator domain-containing protein [Chloroflexi bacterium]|nr:bacterial transcriptional activator domain-containing protein [Chloroflexota bacterium]
MDQDRVPANGNPANRGDGGPAMWDVLRRAEGSCYQAQEWIRQAVKVLGEGHHMLELPQSPPLPRGTLPRSLHLAEAGPASPELVSTANPLDDNLPQPSSYSLDKDASNPFPLRVHCLGKFRVYLDGRLVEGWRNNRAKGILKLLLLNLGKPLPKDIFIEAFWSDYPLQQATNSFRVAVHELRQRLSPQNVADQDHGYILTDGSNYSINTDAPLWVDFQAFESHWRAGRALEKSGRSSEAVDHYKEAEALYQGDFLEEDIYEDWTLLKREALVDIHLSILGKISSFFLKNADYDSCIEFSQKILARDRCREDAYQYIIRCYTNLGFRSRALRWYGLCEETLRRELDCPVSPETRALGNSLAGRDDILGATMLILR